MRFWTPICVASLVFLAACTASKATIQLVNAEQALVRAETHGAPELAPYEYTMAQRYLEKAREEAGYSEFRISDALSRQSAEWSDRAIIFIERRGRTEINLDDFSNVPEVAPPPAPEITPPPPEPELPPTPEGQPSDEELFAPSEPVEPLPPEPEPEPEPEEEEEASEEEGEYDFEESDDDEIEFEP